MKRALTIICAFMIAVFVLTSLSPTNPSSAQRKQNISLDDQALVQAKQFFSRMHKRCGEYYYYQKREQRFDLYQCKYAPTVSVNGKTLQPKRLSEADRLNGVDPLPVAWDGGASINLGLCRHQGYYRKVDLGPDAWGRWEDNNTDALNFKNLKGTWQFYNEATGQEMYTKKVIVPIKCEDVPDANRIAPVNLPSWGKDNKGTLLRIPANYGEWFYLGTGPLIIKPDYNNIYIDGTGSTRGIEGGGSNPQALAPDAQLGALIAKIGKHGPPFQIFKPRDTITQLDGYKVKSSDEVYIAINDSNFRDNRGMHIVYLRGENLCTNCPHQPAVTSSRLAPVSGGVLNGKAISLPDPAYPAIARAAKAAGTVVVQVTIDEKGNVISAAAVSGHPLLRAVATAAARQAKFAPPELEGQPVKVTGVLTYNFDAR